MLLSVCERFLAHFSTSWETLLASVCLFIYTRYNVGKQIWEGGGLEDSSCCYCSGFKP